MKLTYVTFEPPGTETGLDENGVANYFFSAPRKGILYKEVISVFEAALKAEPGYTKEKRPSKKTETPIKIGKYRFVVKTTPQTVNPPVKEVFEYFDGFLTEKMQEYDSGERPQGILTIDGRPYIAVDLAVERIREKWDEVKEESIKQELDVPQGQLVIPEALVIPFGTDFTRLTGKNAKIYLASKAFAENYADTMKLFESALIDSSGYSSENMPKQTEFTWHEIAGHYFKVPHIPVYSTSYGVVMNSFVKEAGKKGPTKTTGDLVRLQMGEERPDLARYKARRRGDTVFADLEALQDRLYELKEEKTKISLRQRPISYYPLKV